MIVAMVAVNMVEVTVHAVVYVITVWNGFVATARTMDMIRVMTVALMRWRASVRVGA